MKLYVCMYILNMHHMFIFRMLSMQVTIYDHVYTPTIVFLFIKLVYAISLGFTLSDQNEMLVMLSWHVDVQLKPKSTSIFIHIKDINQNRTHFKSCNTSTTHLPNTRRMDDNQTRIRWRNPKPETFGTCMGSGKRFFFHGHVIT